MQKVVFSFDDASLFSLQRVTKRGGFSSMAAALRESVELNQIIQNEARDGFTQLLVRNPSVGKEIVVILPSIKRKHKL